MRWGPRVAISPTFPTLSTKIRGRRPGPGRRVSVEEDESGGAEGDGTVGPNLPSLPALSLSAPRSSSRPSTSKSATSTPGAGCPREPGGGRGGGRAGGRARGRKEMLEHASEQA